MPRGVTAIKPARPVPINAMWVWSKLQKSASIEEMFLRKFSPGWSEKTKSYWEGYLRAIRDVQRSIQRHAAKTEREQRASRNK